MGHKIHLAKCFQKRDPEKGEYFRVSSEQPLKENEMLP